MTQSRWHKHRNLVRGLRPVSVHSFKDTSGRKVKGKERSRT